MSPLLAAVHAGYRPEPPLDEASTSRSPELTQDKQQRVHKVNISLLTLPGRSRDGRINVKKMPLRKT